MLRRRPYLTVEMYRAVLADPLRSETQDDGRLRFWGRVALPGKPARRILRVVTLEEGATLPNAFLDRGYREDEA